MDFCSRSVRFLSTPSARRATNLRTTEGVEGKISIHALREEGDRIHLRKSASWSLYFYPRPPRGGRPFASTASVKVSVFLSTPSARRATFDFILNCVVKIISIHALREEGDLADDVECQRRENISIHALREEGDS